MAKIFFNSWGLHRVNISSSTNGDWSHGTYIADFKEKKNFLIYTNFFSF
jgi:hypothetical protein